MRKEQYPEKIYATEKIGTNGVHCLDYRNCEEDVEYIRSAMCEANSNAVLGDGWRDVAERPLPLKGGVKCDRFVICDLNKSIYMAYYIYDEDRWTVGGDDTQPILKWYRVPPAFA